MDASQALADLAEISPQIEAAAIVDETGAALGSTLPDELGGELARLGQRLLDEADSVVAMDDGKLMQLRIETRGGVVFAVREGGLSILATTMDEPTAGLVFYDLRSTLRSMREEPGDPA